MNFNDLKEYTDLVGKYYGSESLSIHLYSWARLLKPKVCVELGTGLGSTSLWMGAAMQENGFGVVHTVDDGTQWLDMQEYLEDNGHHYQLYNEYLDHTINKFDLNDYVKYHPINMQEFTNDVLPTIDDKIGILFSDYRHGPIIIIGLLAKYLPHMAEESLIFIDSAPTYYPSYAMMKDLINQLNSGKNIKLLDIWAEDVDALHEKIRTSKFDLINIYEQGKHEQNSTAVIKITANDIFPPHDMDLRGI